jgi:hypothetical protein
MESPGVPGFSKDATASVLATRQEHQCRPCVCTAVSRLPPLAQSGSIYGQCSRREDIAQAYEAGGGREAVRPGHFTIILPRA